MGYGYRGRKTAWDTVRGQRYAIIEEIRAATALAAARSGSGRDSPGDVSRQRREAVGIDSERHALVQSPQHRNRTRAAGFPPPTSHRTNNERGGQSTSPLRKPKT